MSHAKNKVEWCLRKAERELNNSQNHRGLVKSDLNLLDALKHIEKAEHYLEATIYLKNGGFSDISASTAFYAMYHCLLAIAAKFGYESRNQECTFALIESLIEDKKINFDKHLLDRISLVDTENENNQSAIQIRENLQYGLGFTLDDNLFNDLFKLAKDILEKTRKIIEEK
jgi:uncharacterized protein (UPF0332 family)